jgi:hypothetical protein
LSERDVSANDLGFGFGGALVIMLVCAFTLALANFVRLGTAPSIDRGLAVPIEVVPVADAGLGEGGLASAWQSPEEVAAEVSQRQSSKKKAAVPQASEEAPVPTQEAPTPTELPDLVEPPPLEAVDTEAGPASDTDDATDTDASEVSAETDGQAEGGDAAAGAGGTDPLFDRAVAFYRSRLESWFSAKFRVSGSGLDPAVLSAQHVLVNVFIAEDLTIERYEVLDATHPVFEQAAKDTLDRLVGKTLPPPPDKYPGAVQKKVRVRFRCEEGACD